MIICSFDQHQLPITKAHHQLQKPPPPSIITALSNHINKMKPSLRSSNLALRLIAPPRTAFPRRYLHTSPPKPATIGPITAHGPPPSAPIPSIEHVDIRVARKRQQADLLKRGQDLKSGKAGNAAKTKRFWKDVHVRKVDGMPLHFISFYMLLLYMICFFCASY